MQSSKNRGEKAGLSEEEADEDMGLVDNLFPLVSGSRVGSPAIDCYFCISALGFYKNKKTKKNDFDYLICN